MPMPRRSHQTASLLKLNNAWAEAKGTPLSLRMLAGRESHVVPGVVGKIVTDMGLREETQSRHYGECIALRFHSMAHAGSFTWSGRAQAKTRSDFHRG